MPKQEPKTSEWAGDVRENRIIKGIEQFISKLKNPVSLQMAEQIKNDKENHLSHGGTKPTRIPINALVLSGGGSKGAFQVGAAKYFLNVKKIKLKIITCTSVGTLNGVKLAEGRDDPVSVLESLWLNMNSLEDMLTFTTPVQNLLKNELVNDVKRQELIENLLISFVSTAGTLMTTPLAEMDKPSNWKGPLSLAVYLLELGIDVSNLVDAINDILKDTGLATLDPIYNKLDCSASSELIKANKIIFRGTTVDLETGKTLFIDENGDLLDENDNYFHGFDLKSGVIASASIPVLIRPLNLVGLKLIDGGVSTNIPIRKALEFNPTHVFAIICSPIEFDYANFSKRIVPEVLDWVLQDPIMPKNISNFSIESVFQRSVSLTVDHSSRKDLNLNVTIGGRDNPYFSSKMITTISPSFEIHNLVTVIPGLIKINMDYGYMVAADSDYDQSSLTDSIILLRTKIWWAEQGCFINYNAKDVVAYPTADEIRGVRSMKNLLYKLANNKINQQGRNSLPANISTWWQDWEKHDPVMVANADNPNLWGKWELLAGEEVPAEDPPPSIP